MIEKKHVPDYILERYVLGELPPERMETIGLLARRNSLVRRRIEVIRESSKSILKRYPPEQMAGRIVERAEASANLKPGTGKQRRLTKMLIFPVLAAAAALIIVFIYPLIRSGHESVLDPFINDITRIKGADTRLYIYRKKGVSAESLGNDSLVREKDLLQLAYFTAKHSFGAIISIDGRGGVTLHYPASRNADARLEKNRTILIPRAYELDDAPGFERFIFITSERPIDLTMIYRAAGKIAKNPATAKTEELPLDSSCSQKTILLRKE